MLPDFWQNLKRLLIVSSLENESTIATLIPVLELFQSSIPNIDKRLLIISNQQYNFLPLNSSLKVSEPDVELLSYESHFELIQKIKSYSFEAAIILTAPAQSPFSLAYLCYLAGIPIRVGQSQEFGGGVLSHCIKPPLEGVSFIDYSLHLLQESGLPKFQHPEFAIA